MWRFLGWLLCGLAVAAAGAAPTPAAGRFDRVVVPAAKTSIYFGSVTMIMPEFVRHAHAYESRYEAKVFPFTFSNEQGRVSIEITDDMLARLERGEKVDFKGRGVRDDGAERKVEGTATPQDARSGKLKVRVLVSKRIQLIFNTTYRFEPAG